MRLRIDKNQACALPFGRFPVDPQPPGNPASEWSFHNGNGSRVVQWGIGGRRHGGTIYGNTGSGTA